LDLVAVSGMTLGSEKLVVNEVGNREELKLHRRVGSRRCDTAELPDSLRSQHDLASPPLRDAQVPTNAGGTGDRAATIFRMSTATTTSVEVDTSLLKRLRERFPGRSDRELLEAAARIRLGRDAITEAQERFGLSDEEAIALGVKAVHETR
jgi:hypothetical protein